MKIVYLANVRMPTERAYGIQIVNMCKAFALQGAEVLLLFPFRISRAIKQNVFDYYSVERNFEAQRLAAIDFYLPGSLNKIAFHIKNLFSAIILSWKAAREKADLIYSRDELTLFILSFLVSNLCFEAHSFSGARRIYYRRFKKKQIKVVVISEILRQTFIKEGFNRSDILLAPDAVDIERFNISLSRREAREKTGLPADANIVVYSGHLFGKKGADTLAEAANMVPGALFVFVGGTVREVKDFKTKYSHAPNILILGHQPHKDIPSYLQSADVLVLPNSKKEAIADRFTSPLKLFEYMTSRRPIIASDIPVLREVLNESNSILVQPDQPEILSQAIKQLLADIELQEKISSRAFQDVQNYTWSARAQSILKNLRHGQ